MRPRQVPRALARMGPYLLSHHPHCAPFRSDVVVLAGRRWCIACWLGYPLLAAAALLAWRDPWGWPWAATAAVGLVLALPQGLSFAGRVPTPAAQAAVKACLGIGFGLLLGALLRAPWSLPVRLAVVLAVFTGLQALWVLRLLRLDRTCAACPQRRLRPRCDGLRDLHDRVGGLLSLPGALPAAQAPEDPRKA